jgi:hypothetical protein
VSRPRRATAAPRDLILLRSGRGLPSRFLGAPSRSLGAPSRSPVRNLRGRCLPSEGKPWNLAGRRLPLEILFLPREGGSLRTGGRSRGTTGEQRGTSGRRRGSVTFSPGASPGPAAPTANGIWTSSAEPVSLGPGRPSEDDLLSDRQFERISRARAAPRRPRQTSIAARGSSEPGPRGRDRPARADVETGRSTR